MYCDMHTHSENSHDSNCKIEDMLKSQLEKGTNIFAVTDHFDALFYNDYDIFTPLKRTYETVEQLNKQYKGKCVVLAGVEIGEAFLFPEICEKATNMLDYDVVIGSVHCPKFEGKIYPTALIDFSKYTLERAKSYAKNYYDNLLTMVEAGDFDILAHLTYPVRYLVGKYGFKINLSEYDDTINKILKIIIANRIALEVNSSSYDVLNDFMPCVDLLKRYFEFGGRMVTLGSDAHVAQNASNHFEKAVTVLKDIGFDGIYYYQKRKPYKIPI